MGLGDCVRVLIALGGGKEEWMGSTYRCRQSSP